MFGNLDFLHAKLSYPPDISKVTSLLFLCSFCLVCCCFTQFYSSVVSMASCLETMVATVTSKSIKIICTQRKNTFATYSSGKI